jgi:putative cell wall-binding protein
MTVGILRKAGVAALAAILALVGLIPLASGAGATASFDLTRLNGEDRFGTAAAIATATFPNGADTVLIARADLFPDALAGNYLAGDRTAPILLSRVDAAPQETMTALQTLKAKNVILLGREQALSAAVAAQLTSAGYTVTRVGGEDRYDTASLIAREPGAANVGTRPGTQAPGGRKTAIIANGLNFPDALAAGPISYKNQFPILLTLPNQLPQVSRDALTALGIQHVIIVGETEAVSNEVKNAIEGLNITTERLGGATRYDTAQQIANFAITVLGFSNTHINVARGDDFADALTGGPHGGQENAVIILTEPLNVPTATRTFVQGLASTVSSGHIFGGFAAVSQQVENELETAGGRQAQQGGATVTVASQNVAPGGNVTGTVSGNNIQSVAVSGPCIDNTTLTPSNDRDPNQAGIQFSIPVRSTATGGSCELTFVTTFSDNTPQETDRVTLTVANTQGQGQVTDRPELVSAVFQQFVTNGGVQDQTIVRFTFDEAVQSALVTCANFKLYPFNNTNTPEVGQACTATGSAVDVTFGTAGGGAGPNGRFGPNELRNITLAAVARDAVRDADENQENPDGSEPITGQGTSGGTVTFNEGNRTAAPDLLSIGNFRQANAQNLGTFTPGTVAAAACSTAGATPQNCTLVDFTFDQAAFVTTATGFRLVVSANPNTANGVAAGAGANQEITCATVITVACENTDVDNRNAGATPSTIAADQVARGVVNTNTVRSQNTGGFANPLEATTTPDSPSAGPDLQLVTVQRDTATGNVTTATYCFDEQVGTANAVPGNLNLYRFNGTEVPATGAAGAVTRPTTAPTGFTADQCVVATFAAGLSANDITGGNAEPGSVFDVNGVPNASDEEPLAGNTRTFTGTGGATDGPDLVSVTVTTRNVPNQPSTVSATYVFDEVITGVPNLGRLRLYDAQGNEFTCTTIAGGAPNAAPNNNSVTCTAYTVSDPGQNTTQTGVNATNAQLQAATLGTAGFNSVTDGTNPNPEGDRVVNQATTTT